MSEVQTVAPLGTQIELPCGFFIGLEKGFVFSRKSTIKEMTGKVITQLGSSKVRKNPSLFTTLLLEQCVATVGERKLRVSQFDQLLVADQDYLVLKIRQLSKGDIVNGEIDCAECKEKLTAKIDLTELETTMLEEPTAEELENGFRSFIFSDEELNIKAKFRYPRISDTLNVSMLANENPVAAHNKIMELCLLKFESDTGLFEPPYGKGFIENLPLRQYESLRDGFLNTQPGVDMKYKIECWSCGHENQMEVTASDFLVSAPKK